MRVGTSAAAQGYGSGRRLVTATPQQTPGPPHPHGGSAARRRAAPVPDQLLGELEGVIQQLPAALAEAAHGFGRYLEAERGRSAHTVRAYLSDVGSLLAHAVSENAEDLADLELGTLRRWLGAQSESGMSRATLARRAATARAFTAWAVREELITADPPCG